MQRMFAVLDTAFTWAGTIFGLVAGFVATIAGLLILCHDLIVVSKLSSVFYLMVNVVGDNTFWAFVVYLVLTIVMGPMMMRLTWLERPGTEAWRHRQELVRDDLRSRREAA